MQPRLMKAVRLLYQVEDLRLRLYQKNVSYESQVFDREQN